MVAFRRAAQGVLWIAVVWLFIAGLLVLEFGPGHPSSVSGWVRFIAFGPPIYLLAEAAVEWFWSSRAGRRISECRSSWVRVLLTVGLVVPMCVIAWAALWLVTKL